jgi:hypothetical protein
MERVDGEMEKLRGWVVQGGASSSLYHVAQRVGYLHEVHYVSDFVAHAGCFPDETCMMYRCMSRRERRHKTCDSFN